MRLHRDHAHLCESVADALKRRIGEAIDARGTCHMGFAGGQTPVPLFNLLAVKYAEKLPWDHIHIYWGDERFVPVEDPESNFGAANRHLVSRIPIPASNVHPITFDSGDLNQAASRYEDLLLEILGSPPRLDILMLGMGVDGHTASIFHDSEALTSKHRFVVPVVSPIHPVERVTLTLSAINQARHIYFLVVGSGKSEALKCAFGQLNSIDPCPAKFVEPVDGNVIWWVDAEAAEGL